MSWKQERARTYGEHLDIIQSKKTPLQRRKYIMKSVMDEFKDVDYELKNDKSWNPRGKKEVRNLISNLEDAIYAADTKQAFDRAVRDYVNMSNYYMDKKVMHYRYESDSTASKSFESSEGVSESESESESSESSESESESESESSESESEENDENDEIYN